MVGSYHLSLVDAYTVGLRTNSRAVYQTRFTLFLPWHNAAACICVNCLTDCWKCGVWLGGGKGAGVKISKYVFYWFMLNTCACMFIMFALG